MEIRLEKGNKLMFFNKLFWQIYKARSSLPLVHILLINKFDIITRGAGGIKDGARREQWREQGRGGAGGSQEQGGWREPRATRV
jgi:hypothetical protein